MSLDEFIADRDSLQRMLDDFKADLVARRGESAAAVFPPPAAGGNTSGVSSASASGSSGSGASGRGEAGSVVPLEPSPSLEGMQVSHGGIALLYKRVALLYKIAML